jgi:hypothetical protein
MNLPTLKKALDLSINASGKTSQFAHLMLPPKPQWLLLNNTLYP